MSSHLEKAEAKEGKRTPEELLSAAPSQAEWERLGNPKAEQLMSALAEALACRDAEKGRADAAEGEKENLCMLIRMLLASKHLKHRPDVVQRASDYLTRIGGWGNPLRGAEREGEREAGEKHPRPQASCCDRPLGIDHAPDGVYSEIGTLK